jgi:protein TonB
MFDLIAGTRKTEGRRALLPALVSVGAHATIVSLFIVLPLLYVTDQLPQGPTMMAFIAAPPSPPPPPPPPAPLEPRPAAVSPKPASTSDFVAPVEAPRHIEPEIAAAVDDEGFIGGVEGGIEGGIAGGIVGSIVAEPPPPPPPPPLPPPPAPRAPVRIGGQLKAPALLVNVRPHYPEFAAMAGARGTVILEATVDENGRVLNVRVLRSIPLLDKAAIAAVEQWQYSPLLLNGLPTPFTLSVAITFSPPESR